MSVERGSTVTSVINVAYGTNIRTYTNSDALELDVHCILWHDAHADNSPWTLN